MAKKVVNATIRKLMDEYDAMTQEKASSDLKTKVFSLLGKKQNLVERKEALALQLKAIDEQIAALDEEFAVLRG